MRGRGEGREERSLRFAKLGQGELLRSDYYLVVVFKSYADRLKFTERLKLDDNQYQSSKDIEAAMFPGDEPTPDQGEDEPAGDD